MIKIKEKSVQKQTKEKQERNNKIKNKRSNK